MTVIRNKWLRSVGSLVAMTMLGLGGCAMSPEQKRALDPSSMTVPQGQGMLVARIVSNVSSTPLFLQSTTLILKSDPDGETHRLQSKATPHAGSALFVNALPPGKYQPLELVGAMGNMTMRAPLAGQMGPFELQANRVTDLGAVVFVFESIGAFSGKYRIARISAPDDTGAVLSTMDQAVLAGLTNPPLRADQPINPASNAATLRFGRSLAGFTTRATPRENQPIVFGRTLGMVSIWSPDKAGWTHLDTGRSLTVHSAAFDRNGTLLVGMEEGVLLARRNAAWQTLPSPAKGAIVLFVGQKEDGEYLVVVEDRSAFAVFAASDLESGTWRELRRFPRERFLNPAMDGTAIAALAPGRLIVLQAEGGASSKFDAHNLNFATGQWETVPVDVGAGARFRVLDDGTLATVVGTAFTRTLITSGDYGKTWARQPLENWSMIPAFRDLQTVYMQRQDKIGVFSAAESIASLWKSQDGGKTWAKMGELPKFMTDIYVLPKQDWLMVTTMVGETHISSDDGKSWRMNR